MSKDLDLTQCSDDELVRLVSEGRRVDAAILELCRRYKNRLMRTLVRRIGLSQHDALSAVQNTFVKLWRNAHAYSPGNFKAWLFQIAFREALAERKKEARRAQREAAAGAEELWIQSKNDFLAVAENEQYVSVVSTTLKNMPAKHRQIVLENASGVGQSRLAAKFGESRRQIMNFIEMAHEQIRESLVVLIDDSDGKK